MKKFKVIRSPWPKDLPNGTIVIEQRPEWYNREDGKRIFEQGYDKTYDQTLEFKLFDDEVEPVNE